jgi:DNA excision repair protein ERCC-1
MDDARPRDAAVASAPTIAQISRPADAPNANPHAPKVQQPKPQALPARAGPSSILVSPRQKGNPILNSVRTVTWEYSDIPADYVLGATTCALFLSLKYHRLHPEYIYNRIRDLKGQYQLRVLLVMVDIENHEESLRELSKTSLINNVTIMLTWSAQEAGRYLELFKTFEHAAPTSIKAQQSSTYSDSMVEFITVPRSINKTDAVGLVSNFGSIRTAVNAGPEEIGLIAGWGTKKVQRWCNSVREPFRIKKAAKRGLTRDNTQATLSRAASVAEDDSQTLGEIPFDLSARRGVEDAAPIAADLARTAPVAPDAGASARRSHRITDEKVPHQSDAEGEESVRRAGSAQTASVQTSTEAESQRPSTSLGKRKPEDDNMSEGILAALSKLRKQ